jgi:orotidine-5'-phosphate decarboxylase
LPNNPIFCAIDRPDLQGALELARAVAPHVGGLKLGLEFFGAQGPAGVAAMQALGLPIFLDLKFHDIPNTVAGAVREAARLGVAMLTLHAAGGRAMLEAALEATAGFATKPWLLGVTVLTSLDAADLVSTGVYAPATEHAAKLGALALDAGLDGLVCSPHEIAVLRQAFGARPRLVVPGIRPAIAGDDQKRTMTPVQALALGADLLVVGRPITQAASPAATAAAIAAELARVA